MNNEQFEKGNYNEWDNIVKEVLPNANKIIRYTLLPELDKTLKSMLGQVSQWTREEINVSQCLEDNRLSSILYTISYMVDDFNVPEASKEAIETDQDAIRQALESDEVAIDSVVIDTSNGRLTVTARIPLEEEEDEQD